MTEDQLQTTTKRTMMENDQMISELQYQVSTICCTPSHNINSSWIEQRDRKIAGEIQIYRRRSISVKIANEGLVTQQNSSNLVTYLLHFW